jgi:Bifunctional DNA primase/polymerase, N-terminal/Sigma-70, region 4
VKPTQPYNTKLLPADKLRNISLATALGPVAPFRGKAPLATGWQRDATLDLTLISDILQEFPDMNFGVVAGIASIAVDLDVRPGKDGIAFLSQYGSLPETITVDSGGGGKHLYFRVPADIDDLQGIPKSGLDLKRNGGILVPGSLHPISGKYYEWSPNLSPTDIGLAELPGWIADLLRKPASRSLDDAGSFGDPQPTQPHPDGVLPGKLRPDSWVKRNWMKHVVSGATKGWRNEQDIRNQSSLAFWTCHNWEQYLRIWLDSPEAHSGKVYSPKSATTQLALAFRNKRENFTPKPRKVARKSPIGPDHPNPALVKQMRTRPRPLIPKSPNSRAVLELHQQRPNLTQSQIASQLGLTRQHVHQILKRYL